MTGSAPARDHAAVDRAVQALLLSIADDEFVLGFLDSEWTGIAPMLEEDVAFSSISQDEIGHASLFYEQLAGLSGSDANAIAFGRQPGEYRHCRLLDQPRGDWAFTVARRYLYETSDAVRLEALAAASLGPLGDYVAKIRREERYHLAHVDAWLRRLASGGDVARGRLVGALERLWPDAGTVFTPLPEEEHLVPRILAAPMAELFARWTEQVGPTFRELSLPFEPVAPDAGGRGPEHGEAFAWLWGEFTSVARLEHEAVW
jgi:ring-1,2-phenylacetyl-CoA epoxidase subunit PaaC